VAQAGRPSYKSQGEIMDHNYAIENHVAEGYLLEDLNERERDAYEDHFFGCTTCAEEVETVSEFIDTAKQVIQFESKTQLVAFSAQPEPVSWFSRIMPPMMRYMPAAACALFVITFGVTVYQYQIISQQNHPPIATVITEVTLTHSRASTDVIKTPRGSRVVLKFTIPPSGAENFSSYDVQIATNSGSKRTSLSIPKAQAINPQTIELHTNDLESGTYFLVIRGVNSNQTESGIKGELDRLPFELELQ
jgi:hypothetical protein